MHLPLEKQFRRLASLATLLAVMTTPGRAHAQKIDLNSNGMSDMGNWSMEAAVLTRTAMRMAMVCSTVSKAWRERVPSTRAPLRESRP